MLPGVELARRRRIHHHNHHEIHPRGPPDPTASRAVPPPNRTDMIEPVLLARMRLEERLRRFSAGPRCSGKPVPDRMSPARSPSKEVSIEAATMRKSVRLQRKDSTVDLCAVCLDEVEMQQKITKLPCSHKYHSDCLVPWLASHSQCPCCRTAVPSLNLLR